MTDVELRFRWTNVLTAIYERHIATCRLLIAIVPQFEELRLVVRLALPAEAAKAFEDHRRMRLLIGAVRHHFGACWAPEITRVTPKT